MLTAPFRWWSPREEAPKKDNSLRPQRLSSLFLEGGWMPRAAGTTGVPPVWVPPVIRSDFHRLLAACGMLPPEVGAAGEEAET